MRQLILFIHVFDVHIIILIIIVVVVVVVIIIIIRYNDDLEIDDAAHTAILTLKVTLILCPYTLTQLF